MTRLFNPDLIETAFIAREVAFDADRLRAIMRERLDAAGVTLRFQTDIAQATPAPGGWELASADDRWRTRWVFNCTYRRLNHLRLAAQMPPLPLKQELAELALVQQPPELAGLAVTVMCGPFFSLMPFPPRGLWTLSHVRYTPHRTWSDEREPPSPPPPTHAPLMLRDSARYLPVIAGCKPHGSLWEVKTVLPQHETDDGRPILFHHDARWPGFVSVMGGKLDNVYDLAGELDKLDLAAT